MEEDGQTILVRRHTWVAVEDVSSRPTASPAASPRASLVRCEVMLQAVSRGLRFGIERERLLDRDTWWHRVAGIVPAIGHAATSATRDPRAFSVRVRSRNPLQLVVLASIFIRSDDSI